MAADTQQSLQRQSEEAIRLEDGPHDPKPEPETSPNDQAFISGGKLALILAALYATMFLVALVRMPYFVGFHSYTNPV